MVFFLKASVKNLFAPYSPMVVYAYLEDEGLVKYDFELEGKTWLVDYHSMWEI